MDFNGIDKLHVGCGTYWVKGWLNIGLFKEQVGIPYGTAQVIDGAYVLHFDLTKELPIAEGSIRYIYASHFIEHLRFPDGIAMVGKWFGLMKKDGVLRLTFPDLELWIKNYYENNLAFFKQYKAIHLQDGEKALAETKGEIFMSQVHNWGHRWNYDFESIKHVLSKCGFTQIYRRNPFESLIPDIRMLEPDNPGRLMETAYVEAVK